jgi:predicted TIM-barrel fold metal-dependent hydrolase
MKIDIFTHIFPPRYWDVIKKHCPQGMEINPALIDLEQRFRIMDRFEEYRQVLTFSTPPLEAVVNAEAAEFARWGNEELAEIIHRYPDRFIGGVANLPMNDIEASLQEIDRAKKNWD